MTDTEKCCCTCKHNKRTGEVADIKTHCDIDGHYIGYVANFNCVCDKWERSRLTTYSMPIGNRYKMRFSDIIFKPYRKKPTISIYDLEKNCETKIASFNSQETFEWFIDLVMKNGYGEY